MRDTFPGKNELSMPSLPGSRLLSRDPQDFLRRYFNKIVFVPSGSSLAISSLALFAILTATGFIAWWAIEKWGREAHVVADESSLQQSGQISDIWYSATGDLLGYRQEGWKVTLIRWSAERNFAPSSMTLDLDPLTPPDADSAKVSGPLSGVLETSPKNSYAVRPQNQAKQFAVGSSNTSSPKYTSRSSAAPLVAVSQDLVGVVWSWQGKLYWTVLGEQAKATPVAKSSGDLGVRDRPGTVCLPLANLSVPFAVRPAFLASALSVSSKAETKKNSSRTVLSHSLPEVAGLVGLHFVGATGLVLEDQGNQRIWLFDLKEWNLLRYIKAPTPCAVDVLGARSLVVCPASAEVMVLDFSSPGHVDQTYFQVPTQKSHSLGVTAAVLARDGTPAVATDQGTVLYWHGLGAATELQSPGVAQALESDGQSVLVGGGFRGIYQLRPDAPPRLVIKDVTGTTLLALKDMEYTSKGLRGGNLAFGTRQGVSVARLRETRSLNQWGYSITGSWLFFLITGLVVIPLGRLWVEERSRQREVGLRTELERSYERVPVNSAAESTAPISLPDPPEDLIRACVSGECVAFIGAGLGAQAGLPTWRRMIQSLLTEVSRQKLIDPEKSAALQEALEDGQTNVVADELVDKLRGHEHVIHQFLSQTYIRQDIRPTQAHGLLRSLNLSAILTTNFDELLEMSFINSRAPLYTHQDAGQLLEALTKRQFFLAKLYGSLNRPDTLLMARSQFEEAMARSPLFSRFMQTLFFSRTLFFVGAGFEGIESYLSGIKFASSIERRHFALVAAQGGAWRAKADQLLRRFGIQVLAFSPVSGFLEVEQFLHKLAAAVQLRLADRVAASKGQEAVAKAISRLQSVTLTNIGPFDKLEMNLDAGWTILLGDNGVGKSTVLRAIAVGLAGSEAADFAGRLLKAGKELEGGSITLHTDNGRAYTTRISKGDRTIVQSDTSRPLESESWLALGFPPLRSFTLAPVGDLPSKGLQRLTADDLLPLVRGDVDPRPDRLKAWLIDLDYRDKDQRLSNRNLWSYFRAGESQTQFTTLLEQFFRVIRKLTPGLRLDSVKIDPVKKEVIVDTDDGTVRIELVSQGTQSLLGWVGVLLQRLNDFYASDTDGAPSTRASGSLLDQHALVLMDEIDAHMHPFWQKRIISSLRELFPNMQFIATTHSPLIVSSLRKENVRIFERDVETGKVTAVVPESDFEGLRSDQILTSPLFRLRTTRASGMVEKMERYSELLGKRARAKEKNEIFASEDEFIRLQGELQEKLRPGESIVYKEIEEAVQKTLLAMRSTKSVEGKAASDSISLDEKLKIRYALRKVLGEESERDRQEEKK
jgi:AAA domain, putative AbiEii toxin, Type IV TA system/SIR2-like domain